MYKAVWTSREEDKEGKDAEKASPPKYGHPAFPKSKLGSTTDNVPALPHHKPGRSTKTKSAAGEGAGAQRDLPCGPGIKSLMKAKGGTRRKTPAPILSAAGKQPTARL